MGRRSEPKDAKKAFRTPGLHERGNIILAQRLQEKKLFRLQAKQFFLTYPKCYSEKQAVADKLLEKWKSEISGYCIAKEDHEDGTPHIHMLLRFNEKKNFKDPECFDFLTGQHGNYQTVRSFKSVLEYIKKDADYIMFGDILLDKNWQDIANSTTEVELWKNLWDLKPRDAMLSGDRIVNNWRKRRRALEPPKPPPDPDIEVANTIEFIWFYGPGGSGKDRRVNKWAFDNQVTLYRKKSDTEKWWCDYNGEEAICFEDFRGSDMKPHNFLQLTDPHRQLDYMVQTKGGHTTLKAKTIFVTSSKHPIDCWKMMRTDPIEWGMLKRRITNIYRTEYYQIGDVKVGMKDMTNEPEPDLPAVRPMGPFT